MSNGIYGVYDLNDIRVIDIPFTTKQKALKGIIEYANSIYGTVSVFEMKSGGLL